MKIVASLPRYDVQIYIGTQVGYTNNYHSLQEIYDLCKEFCDENKVAVTVNPTDFIYPGGEEPGAIIGLINYPRFPSCNDVVMEHAITLAYLLMEHLDQFRCSIFSQSDIYLLENDKINQELEDRT